MRRWMRRFPLRNFATGLTLVALLVAESSARQVRPHHEEQFRPPAHSHVLADTASTKRPLTVLKHRSLLNARVVYLLPPQPSPPRRGWSIAALDRTSPLPPARMRYRRSTHDADGEPPA